MTRFDICLKFVLAREGGFVDDPKDRGGRTNKGITQSTYDEWCDLTKRQRGDVKDIPDEQVAAIYHRRYWLASKCDTLPPPVDLLVFDAAVNHGPSRAIKLLQDALRVPSDGDFGPRTERAMQDQMVAGKLRDVVDYYRAHRIAFYQRIVERDPSQKRFLNGWLNRISALEVATNLPTD